MERFNLKFGLTVMVCLLAIGCNDDKSDPVKREPGKISDDDISLTYDATLLKGNIKMQNKSIDFDRLDDDGAERSLISTRAFEAPDLNGAIEVKGSGTVNIDEGTKIYFIPEGETFTGSINYTARGTLYILGTWAGNRGTNVAPNATVIVGPNGKLESTVNFALNNSSTFENYGVVSYGSGTIDGTVKNYNEMSVAIPVNVNGTSKIINECGLTFKGLTYINATWRNKGYIVFEGGFSVNGTGKLIVADGSLTDVTGGTISIDGKVLNENNIRFARIDIFNATIGTMNANPAFTGRIDINATNEQLVAALQAKADSDVTFNQNAYIAEVGCNPGRGTNGSCDGNDLAFTLVATVQSPMVGNDTLSATDVRINNGKAYVSYHTNDEVYGNSPDGALRIIDIQGQEPSLLQEAIFSVAEFNGVDVNGSDLYAMGNNKEGGLLIYAPLTSGLFKTDDLAFDINKISGKGGGKNSFKYNGFVWLVSGGADGGFFKLDPANDFQGDQLYNNGARSKYVVQNSTKQVFFAVEENGPFLRIANIDGSNAQNYDADDFPGLKQEIITGKNTLAIDDEFVYVALSDRGVMKVKLADGELMNVFEPKKAMMGVKRVFPANGATNAVAVSSCFVFLANGADGVIVLRKDNFDVVGKFDIDNSSNYIYVKDNILFVATGRGGLNIIKMTN